MSSKQRKTPHFSMLRLEGCKTPGDYMYFARCRAGMSVSELAELSGVSVGAISDWERDFRSPRLAMMEFVADALGISIDEYTGHSLRRARARER